MLRSAVPAPSPHPPRPSTGAGVLTRGLVVVDADALQLEVRVPHIVAAGVYPVLVTDDLPELQGGEEGSAGAYDPHQALSLPEPQPCLLN